MIVLTWLKERFMEPSTWLGIGIGLMSVSFMFPTWIGALMIAAILTVIVGVVLKEKSN